MQILKDIVEKIKKNKKVSILIGVLSLIIIIYLGMSIFFINHFTFRTYINGVKQTGSTVEEVEKSIKDSVESYTLTIKGRDGVEEVIKGSEIGIQHIESRKVEKLLKKQNPFGWITSMFKEKDYEVKDEVKYNEEILNEKLASLESKLNENVVEPQSATIEYKNGKYEIVNEVQGNKILKDKLYEEVSNYVSKGIDSINLSDVGCYEAPKYDSNSKEVKEALDTANKYIATKIKYEFGGIEEEIDSSIINEWIEVDNALNVTINTSKVRTFVDKLSSIYNTYGINRKFRTSSGAVIDISTGDYGWIVNKAAEIDEITNIVKEGQTVTKEPTFSQEGKVYSHTNDYGDSYVEIDLASQHLWLYKDGKLIIESDLVSGSEDKGYGTPGGLYYIKYKELNATLRGEDYETPVSYWIPFNGGIGLHDAWWRTEFGGDIYLTNGSHGCINLPESVAKTIYENVSAGTPVVCYFDYEAAAKRKAEKINNNQNTNNTDTNTQN